MCALQFLMHNNIYLYLSLYIYTWVYVCVCVFMCVFVYLCVCVCYSLKCRKICTQCIATCKFSQIQYVILC